MNFNRLTLAIACSALALTGANGSPAVAETNTEVAGYWTADPSQVVAKEDIEPMEAQSFPWGFCGVGEDANKLVSNFDRALRATRNSSLIVPAGNTTFKCGLTGWGYFHLLNQGHDDDFENLAYQSNYPWQQIADIGMTKALSDPVSASYNSEADTVCYSATIYYVDYLDGSIDDTAVVRVIMGNGNWNIISAYPQDNDAQC